MRNNVIRLKSIEINHFKNVAHGFLGFENKNSKSQANILGLYGQNGSGKTTLIDVLELLKTLLCGMPVAARFSDFIQTDNNFSTIRYTFQIEEYEPEAVFTAIYEVSLRKSNEPISQNTDLSGSTHKEKAEIFNEVLSASYSSKDIKERMSTIVDTDCSDENVFLPRAKYNLLFGKSKTNKADLIVAKKLTRSTSRSFIFSKEFLDELRNDTEKTLYHKLFEHLVHYGNTELFVINTVNSGLISLNALPLSFNIHEKGISSIGNILISLNDSSLIPEQAFQVVENTIRHMNVVLEQLVPGLTISVQNLGFEYTKDGTKAARIQLFSNKNSKVIPLQYESEGIKKLISVLQLLIVVYNKPSITVAIDELDSGIFEYLLGEILRIISEKGKGQLIFTSHNLRPLETLDKGCIAFTTTNLENRYIRLSNVKATNNLRDFYYRSIFVSGQDELVYDPTNNSEIAMAFKEAGTENEE